MLKIVREIEKRRAKRLLRTLLALAHIHELAEDALLK